MSDEKLTDERFSFRLAPEDVERVERMVGLLQQQGRFRHVKVTQRLLFLEALEALEARFARPGVPAQRVVVSAAFSSGDGLVSVREAARVAVEHGANSESAARGWVWTVESRFNRQSVVEFIRLWLAERPRAGTFRVCASADCVCRF